MKGILLVVVMVIPLIFTNLVYGQSSAHYKIETSIISGGGGDGSSTNYDLSSTLAQPSGIGISFSNNYDNYTGSWYAIEGRDFFYLPLEIGWNLFSLPLQPSNTSIPSVLSDISGLYTIVWSCQNGKWKMYDPANPGFSDLTSMGPGYGYWIKVTESCTWTLP